MDKDKKLYIAGHTGLFGSALYKRALKLGYTSLVIKTHMELDLTRQSETEKFFELEKPDYVIVAAALVGGIAANEKQMADFCMKNAQITCNLIDAAHTYGVKKLLYLGSPCIYPRECKQPIREETILTGSCEPTNEGYALAKIMGIRLCEYYKKQYGDNFISCIPANAYGPNDCFDSEKAHVIPAMLMKFHEAKRDHLPSVTVWGSGNVEREFIYIHDAASNCMNLFETYDGIKTINIGSGKTITIMELAETIKKVTGYEGDILYDLSKPDGMPKRLLDHSTAEQLGIETTICLDEGIKRTYDWYCATLKDCK